MPTFDTLDSALRDASAELEAAEAHGILSGLACFGGPAASRFCKVRFLASAQRYRPRRVPRIA